MIVIMGKSYALWKVVMSNEPNRETAREHAKREDQRVACSRAVKIHSSRLRLMYFQDNVVSSAGTPCGTKATACAHYYPYTRGG